MFTDKVELTLIAGKGGNGIIAWRRARYLPKGGPAGGNGGKGGSIILRASHDLFSLDHFRNLTIIKAEHGADGGPNNRQGHTGKDKTLLIPCGTIVKDLDTGDILFDFLKDGETYEICQGGKGGLGNTFFKSATNRTPRHCTQGKPGLMKEIEFELKLIADIGFVGFPNAGKSTLLSTLTPNQVKIGNYPFTTLKPNLSFIEFDDYSRIMLADIPGIIKDAHTGKGLGLEFLRHIERSHSLIILLDPSPFTLIPPWQQFELLKSELYAYNEELLQKPHLVVLNKCDLKESQDRIEEFKRRYPQLHGSLFTISALTKEGLEPLIQRMRSLQKEQFTFSL